MLAARIHGPKDLRVEQVPHPGEPGPGMALIRVATTGICGSDLHSYLDARIGDTPVQAPLILGHEFSGRVELVGPNSSDGHFEPLQPGIRVAVDPAQPCGRCEFCEQGHPNLCRRLHFCGNYPDGGSFCEWMHMPARSCFALPNSLDDEQGALLEPLGVAVHAVDLAKPRVGDSLAILGAGPIGLLILQVARLTGASPIFISDKFPWRLKLAEQFGGTPVSCDEGNPVEHVLCETGGRGVDVAIEAAWADHSVADSAEMARLGGRLVLVGIPSDDRVGLKHSTARRKGLTIRMSRRMKHVYPRSIRLVEEGRVDLKGLISHRFPLERAVEAFRLNAEYADQVVKVMVES
ncbi:MAG: alcohol dehydrogenase catalytic domain-containing protein [Verrucomicrobiales bacterium]|nr:alcohol dehydrogenase catalytic domain-containing protein [Verrucomicrobiales bacterium]